MATVSVYNMEGSEVGKMDLNDNVFAANVNEHLMHMAAVLQLANKRQGYSESKDSLRSTRRWKKTLETERNWSCKTGFYKSSTVDRRWSCICSNT